MGNRKKQQAPPGFLTPSGNSHEHHIRLYDNMLNSPAWRSLSNGARTLYITILSQYKGVYSGDTVICPYSYMEEHGIRRGSIPKWLDELKEKGFIKIQGGGLYKQPNHYELIKDWFHNDQLKQ